MVRVIRSCVDAHVVAVPLQVPEVASQLMMLERETMPASGSALSRKDAV